MQNHWNDFYWKLYNHYLDGPINILLCLLNHVSFPLSIHILNFRYILKYTSQ